MQVRPRPQHPWVVLDWGALRSIPAGEGLPGGFIGVIPDWLINEVLTSKKPTELFKKLESIVFHPSSKGRILVGRYWEDMALEQKRPSQIIAGSAAAIEWEVSTMLLKYQEQRSSFDHDPSEPLDFREDHKTKFAASASKFEELIREQQPGLDRRIKSGQNIEEVLWSYPSFFENASRMLPWVRGRSAWKQEFEKRIDRAAVSRWCRIILWYFLVRVRSPEELADRFANNQDDAYYVFLSLYTNHLCTQDKGMTAAARAVSKGRIHTYTSVYQAAEALKAE